MFTLFTTFYLMLSNSKNNNSGSVEYVSNMMPVASSIWFYPLYNKKYFVLKAKFLLILFRFLRC